MGLSTILFNISNNYSLHPSRLDLVLKTIRFQVDYNPPVKGGNDMSEFANKSVLITGAGWGIGRETALAFGADGARVCVNYANSVVEAEQTVQEIEAASGRNMR